MRGALALLLLFGGSILAEQPTLKACFVIAPAKHGIKSSSQPDTQEIQHALNLCSPGMAVVLTRGKHGNRFQSGPLLLPRGITLVVGDGVVLAASRNPQAYDTAPGSCAKNDSDAGKIPRCRPFIFSYQAAYSGITGPGVIDGQNCPVLVADYESQGFHISEVTLRNATRALVSIEKTIDLSIADVNLAAPKNGKTTGIVLSNVVKGELSDLWTRVPGAAISVRPNILGPTQHIRINHLEFFGGPGPAMGDVQDVKEDRVIGNDLGDTPPRLSGPAIGLTTVLHFGNKDSLVVAQDGSGNFSTVQAAIDALPDDGGDVLVEAGTYREVVTIRKPHVHLHGDAASDPAKTVIVYNNAGPTHGGTFNSSTLFVEADDTTLDHLTVANDAGPHAGQAVALSVTADRAIFRHMRFLGAQDTLFAASRYCYGDNGPCIPARQYFADSYIEGGVDFIFGDAKAVFEHCELHGIPAGNVMFTAQSKHTPDQDSGYVFKDCKLTGDKRSPGVIALGRAWRPYATVVYLNAEIDAPVLPAGWVDWLRFGVSTLPTAFFAEYQSTGPGASPQTRELYSHQLTADEAKKWASPAFLAAKDGWIPAEKLTSPGAR